MNIKELVQGNVKFLFYRKGELWYETANGFKFPVPIEDTGEAEFGATDKGMLFMRWIRKQVAAVNEGKNG